MAVDIIAARTFQNQGNFIIVVPVKALLRVRLRKQRQLHDLKRKGRRQGNGILMTGHHSIPPFLKGGIQSMKRA
jgi:hypothetical protein